MKHPFISVIISVYNGQDTIMKSTLSVLPSSNDSIEVVIVNDGSTDETYSITKSLSKQDARIRVIHQSNQGVSAARNIGLKEAKGDWVMFIDADDWVNRDNFVRFIKLLNIVDKDVDICTFAYTTVLNEGEVLHKEQNQIFCPDDILSSAMFKLASWNYIFRRKLLIDNRISFPLGVICAEDQCFNIKSLCVASKVQSFDFQLYYYNCCNAYSASKSKHSSKWIKSRLIAANDILCYCVDHNIATVRVISQIKRIYEAYMDDLTTDISFKEKKSFFKTEYNKTLALLPEFRCIKKLYMCYCCMWIGLFLFKTHRFLNP